MQTTWRFQMGEPVALCPVLERLADSLDRGGVSGGSAVRGAVGSVADLLFLLDLKRRTWVGVSGCAPRPALPERRRYGSARSLRPTG